MGTGYPTPANNKPRQDKTNSLLTRVMIKHTRAFFLRSARAQRETKLLRTHTANVILRTLKTCTLIRESKRRTRGNNEGQIEQDTTIAAVKITLK